MIDFKSQWEFYVLPFPARCSFSEGKWIVGDRYYIDATGRLGAYPALYSWDDEEKKPEPVLDIKADKYSAHYATRSGFCGALLKGETQSIPSVWENGQTLQFDRGGHKMGIVHYYNGKQAVGTIRVPGEESWNNNDKAVLWDADGNIVWLGPEGQGSSANFTNGQQQVGEICEGTSRTKACRWFGSAETLQILHPSQALRSEATKIVDDKIFGWVSHETDDHPYEIESPGYWCGDENDWNSLLPVDGNWLGGTHQRCEQ
ncbi:MAG: hypothetical protein R3E90_16045 [Marinicella sp.]|nr:hypothetical protein [Xanthomonadales bacterium]